MSNSKSLSQNGDRHLAIGVFPVLACRRLGASPRFGIGSKNSWPRTQALAVLVNLACVASGLFAAEPRPAAMSAEQLRQISSLMNEFRQVRSDPAKRLEVIDRAAQMSPAAVKNLLEIINKELGKQLADYRELFMKAASQAVAKRTGEANLQEILELRNRVLLQARNENLTKEMIVSVSDPALARLKTLILFDRLEILKQYAQLEPRREALQVLGEQWQRCGSRLIQQDDGGGNSAHRSARRRNGRRRARSQGAIVCRVPHEGGRDRHRARLADEPADTSRVGV